MVWKAQEPNSKNLEQIYFGTDAWEGGEKKEVVEQKTALKAREVCTPWLMAFEF